ncbi:MAG: hypothetical protein R3250_09320 [Melioribacteraceae bacterium]|nr:hypothetical protein [Melioribacteraceae bacterium]
MNTMIRGIGIGLLMASISFTFLSIAKTSSTAHIDSAPKGYEFIKSGELKSLKAELTTSKEQLAQIQLDLASISTGKDTKELTDTNKATPKEIKAVLIIRSGMDSAETSSLLEQMNIIKNRKEFNQYLTDNLLTESIQIGTYELDSSMTNSEIAALITK